jgi:putative endonuclease
MRVNTWTVYIIEAANGKLYTGITTDLARRFNEHQQGKRGARFFRVAAARCVRYQETALDRAAAARREAYIKALTRAQKLALIAAPPP